MRKHTDKKTMTKEYEELLIRMALNKFAEEEGEKLLKENEILRENPFFTPSDANKQLFQKKLAFHYRKNNLKNLFYPNKSRRNRIALVISVIVIGLSISVVTVKAFQTEIYNFFVEMKDDHTEIRLDNKTDNIMERFLQGDYTIEVPSDYNVDQFKRIKDSLTVTYKNSKNEFILFEQSNDNTTTNLDSEEADIIDNVAISTYSAVFSKKGNILSLVWSNNERVFYISTNSESITKEDLIKIGESFKVK